MKVRDAALEVMRRREFTVVFANPGSTEVPLLVHWPEQLRFVLGLHEGSVVGMATGWALGRGRPALVLLHTTAGLGNAVGALATARANRAPLVVVVGQQDRRHLAAEPFLAGRLEGLAGDYPVSVEAPVRPQDVPAAIDRAYHRAAIDQGPALVIVPMDDWEHEMGPQELMLSPRTVIDARAADGDALSQLVGMLRAAERPAIVVGAGADDERSWSALVSIVENLDARVWQEPFGARAGFPQDHGNFAGHLPAARSQLRAALAGHDLVVVVGTSAFRQYPFEPGGFVDEGVRTAVITDDAREADRSPVDLAILAPVASACEQLARGLEAHPVTSSRTHGTPDGAPPRPATPHSQLTSSDLLQIVSARAPANAILLEEAPSDRPRLHELYRARRPLGFVSAAMGGLGFALPGAVGLRIACPDRPVICIVGDGSSLYAIQAVWSAVEYGAGVVFVVVANGGYAIMDRLATSAGGTGPWPKLDHLSVSGLAESFGCQAVRVRDAVGLEPALDGATQRAERGEPTVIEVDVAPTS